MEKRKKLNSRFLSVKFEIWKSFEGERFFPKINKKMLSGSISKFYNVSIKT